MEGVRFEIQGPPWRWVLWPPAAHTGGAMVSGWFPSRAAALEDLERFRAAVAAAEVKGGER